MNIKKISILGGGSWGTVLSNLACNSSTEVLLWLRDREVANEINSSFTNIKYLPNKKLNPNIKASVNIEDIENSQVLIYCIPSEAFRDVVQLSQPYVSKDAFLVTATKGVERERFCLMSKVLEEYFTNPVGILSGPNLAQEIVENHLTGTVIASKSKQLQDIIVSIFQSDSFRVYKNNDPNGVELGGTLKNIYALACGIADGLDCGENTIGMIMTRGLGEMSRFAESLGANPKTFLGLSGVGDLITTCASPLSRNHKIGKYLGQGLNLEDAQDKIGQTVEGIRTLNIVWEQANKLGVNMPIVNSLYKIIFKNFILL